LARGAQIVTLIVWCAGRFFLYTSYYSIFGALFGFTNFGRMLAIDNTVNGLFGLLQLPLTNWGLHGLHGNFTAINMIQARNAARPPRPSAPFVSTRRTHRLRATEKNM
jgi:hypothetical protein